MSIESTLAYLGRCWGSRRGASRIFGTLRKKYVAKYLYSQDPWIVIQDYDRDLKIRVNRSLFGGSCIYWHGTRGGTAQFLNNLLKPDMVFVDIGANQGEETLPAAKRLTVGKVISFEPVPTTFAQLQHNIELNHFTNVHAMNCALSDQPGQMKLYTSTIAQTYGGINADGLASLFPSDYRDTPIAEVQVDTLDNVLSQLEVHRLDIIKIDVEGAEYHVLRGAAKILEKFHPYIFAEVSPDALQVAETSVSELLTFLWSLGYQIERIKRNRRILVKQVEEITSHCDVFCSIPGQSSIV